MRKSATQTFDFSGIAKDVIGAASSRAGDLKNIKDHPFETVFRYLAPGWLFMRGSWVLALLIGAAESVLGIGPSTLGAMVDKALGFGGGRLPGQISTSQLSSVSSNITDKIFGGLIEKSEAFRYELASHGRFDVSSLAVAWAAGPGGIEKFAIGVSRQSGLLRWLFQLPGGRQKGLLSGALYNILKFLAIGLSTIVGFDVLSKKIKDVVPATSGLGSMFGPATEKTQKPGMRLYTNPVGNVERSLVMALDNTIKDKGGKPFSKIFIELKGYAPIGSSEMGRVLSEVRAAHGGADIREINGYRSFAAPPLAEVAKMLLPQATYAKKTKEETAGKTSPRAPSNVERELESIFGGPR